MVLLCVALTLVTALPLLLAGDIWYMAQYSLAGIPLAVGAWLSTRRRPHRRRLAATALLVASFPLAIWAGQLPTSIAWVRLVAHRDGGGLWLGDVNSEALYIGLGVGVVVAAVAVQLALRLQVGHLSWPSFAIGALGSCFAMSVVFIALRSRNLDGAIVQSLALAVWLAALSFEWAIGFRGDALAPLK